MKKGIEIYQEKDLSLESYWRSIILFGRNAASYKFALGKSLLELAKEGKTSTIKLEDLAEPYSKNICEHLKKAPKQTTSLTSKFLEACGDFNNGIISKDELLSVTYKLGFENVIDAFHKVNRKDIDIKFYEKDYRKVKQIVLTDDIYRILEGNQKLSIYEEVESRWNLVETAWELGINPNLLKVEYNDENEELYMYVNDYRRKDITSVRGALNGYQKGKCFYCNCDISISTGDYNLCDVDHFYPYKLKSQVFQKINIDGVWNLVLSCRDCNRGKSGKFDSVADGAYLKKLYNRNEYLIISHNPLRETLINQLGNTAKERLKYIQNVDKFIMELLPTKFRWKPVLQGETII